MPACREQRTAVGCTLHVHIQRRLYSALRIIRNDDDHSTRSGMCQKLVASVYRTTGYRTVASN